MNVKLKAELGEQCAEMLRKLMAKYGFLQPGNPNFDVWDQSDAANLAADLIVLINKSSAIEDVHSKYDWGK